MGEDSASLVLHKTLIGDYYGDRCYGHFSFHVGDGRSSLTLLTNVFIPGVVMNKTLINDHKRRVCFKIGTFIDLCFILQLNIIIIKRYFIYYPAFCLPKTHQELFKTITSRHRNI